MTYPTPNISSVYNATQYMNSVTNNMFWIIILCSLSTIIFFIAYRKSYFNPAVGFASSSFIFLLGSIFLSILGLVSGNLISIGAVLFAFSVFALMLSRDTTI